MKKIIILSLILTIVSCEKKTKTLPEKIDERHLEIVKKEMSKRSIDLDGKYSIVSLQVFPEVAKDSLWANKFPHVWNGKFNFSKKEGTVTIESDFGIKYFGDTIFKYKIEDKFISLKNANKDIELPYINDAGIIRLLIKKKGIEHVTITPSK